MAKRIPIKDRPKLIRDPSDWATDHGWVSRRRAIRAGQRLREIADVIDETMGDDAKELEWGKALREVARYIAPTKTPAERKRARREKVAAMQEP